MKSIFLITSLLTSATGTLINKNYNNVNLQLQTNQVIENLALSYKNKDAKPEQITYPNYLNTIQNSTFLSSLQTNITVTVDLSKFTKCTFFNPNVWDQETNYNWVEAANLYQKDLSNAIIEVISKLLIISMVSNIADYYVNSNNPSKNEIISNNINIINDLANDIKMENDTKYEHSLFNKNGNFFDQLTNFNIPQIIIDYQNGKINSILEKYNNISYNTNILNINNTSFLTELMSKNLDQAEKNAGIGGLSGNSHSSDNYLLSFGNFNLNLTYGAEVYCNYLSVPTPWGGVPQDPKIFFQFVPPSLFDLSLT